MLELREIALNDTLRQFVIYKDVSMQPINKKTLKEIITLAGPMSAGHVLVLLNSTLVSFILGSVGDDEQKAVAFIALLEALTREGAAAAMVGMPICARMENKRQTNRKPEQVGVIYRQGVKIALGFTAASSVILLNIGSILQSAGQDKDVANAAQAYMNTYVMASPAVMLNIIFRDLNNAIGHQHKPMVMYVINSGIFTPLALGLTFGQFGMPKMGAFGLGLASAIAHWTTFFGHQVYLKNRKDIYGQYQLFTLQDGETWGRFKQMALIGAPILGLTLTDIGSNLLFSTIIGALHPDDLTAVGPMLTVVLVKQLAEFGMMDATMLLAAEAFINKNLDRIKELFSNGFVAMNGASVTMAIMLMGFSDYLFDLASEAEQDNEEYNQLKQMFVTLLVIDCTMGLGRASKNLICGILAGIDDLMATLKINVFSAIAVLGPMFTIAWFADFDTETINIIRNAAPVLAGAIACARFMTLTGTADAQSTTSHSLLTRARGTISGWAGNNAALRNKLLGYREHEDDDENTLSVNPSATQLSPV